MNKNNISEIIRNIRNAKGYSQDFVAKKLGITQQAYATIEKKPENASLTRLRELSKILEVELTTLIGEEDKYILQNFNQQGGNTQMKMYSYNTSTAEKELYERLIKTKDDEILYLKSTIHKSLSKV